MHNFNEAWETYVNKEWPVIPVIPGTKRLPLRGVTGREGVDLTREEIEFWAGRYGTYGIALRMPPGVIGIDVDAYEGKNGAETLGTLVSRYGPLPATAVSSARLETSPESGIRFFRVPLGTELVSDLGVDSGIEIIQRHHRYAVVSPTVNPKTSSFYEWNENEIPSPGDLPILPERWLEGLRREPREVREPAVPMAPEDIDDDLREWVSTTVMDILEELRATPRGYRNVAVFNASLKVGRLVARGVVRREAAQGAIEQVVTEAEFDAEHIHTIENGLRLGESQGWEPWPPRILPATGRARQEARCERILRRLLSKAAGSIRDRRNGREAEVEKQATRLGRYSEGLTEERAWTVVRAAAITCGLLEADGRRAFEAGWAAGGEALAAWPPNDDSDLIDRPSWEVGDAGDFVDILAERIGREALGGIYRRDQRMVHCIAMGEDGYTYPPEDQIASPYQIRDVGAEWLRMKINRQYFLFRVAGTRDDENGGEEEIIEHILAPYDAVRTVCGGVGLVEGLPVLNGVTHTPVLLPTGRVILSPGYDEATGWLYLPTDSQPVVVPNTVSEDDVRKARELIDELLSGFPFVEGSDKATFLAFLMTPFLRMLPGCGSPWPWPAFNANVPATGKTKLAEVLGVVHGFAKYPPLPDNDEELRKRLTSILKTDTAGVIIFDNIATPITSGVIAMLATTEQWSDRILGSSESAVFSNDRVWCFTGNNIQIGGDLGRRIPMINLDAGVPNPWLRTEFKWNLNGGELERRRGEVLSALLTIGKGWVDAGSPRTESGRGDFGEWIGAMRGLVMWAGFEGEVWPNDSIEEPATVDEWGTFLRGIENVFGEGELISVQDVALACQGVGKLRNFLPGDLNEEGGLGAPFTKKLGYTFRKQNKVWAGPKDSMRRLCRTAKKVMAKSGASKGSVGYLWYIERQPGFDSSLEDGSASSVAGRVPLVTGRER